MSVHDMPELEDYCNVFEGRGNPKGLENKLLIFRLLNLFITLTNLRAYKLR